METKDLESVREHVIRLMKETSKVKNKEYARGDALSNFKKAAQIQDIYPEDVAINYMMKHFVSILDLVGDIPKIGTVSSSIWDEKIVDMINYLVLLRAMAAERRGEIPTSKITPILIDVVLDKQATDDIAKGGRVDQYLDDGKILLVISNKPSVNIDRKLLEEGEQ